MKSIEEIKKEILLRVMSEGDLSWEYIKTLPKDDSLRTFMCELGSKYAYDYAIDVDKSPHEETRKSSSRSSFRAYQYAYWVDKSPRDDTRKAACGDPYGAYRYAYDVDKSSHEETRKAAYRDPFCRNAYIDKFGD